MGKTRAYGADCVLLAAFEASYGVLPADGYGRLSFKESSLGAERPLGYDPLLGQGRDAQDPFYEAIKDEGDIGVPLDVRALGFWLKGLFGAPATADNGDTTFNHVFTSGGTLPSLAIEIGHVFTPRQMDNADRILKAALSQPTAVGVVVTVNNHASGTQARAEQSQGADGRIHLDIIVEEIEGRMSRRIGRGEGMAPMLEHRYGLNPAAGTYR